MYYVTIGLPTGPVIPCFHLTTYSMMRQEAPNVPFGIGTSSDCGVCPFAVFAVLVRFAVIEVVSTKFV